MFNQTQVMKYIFVSTPDLIVACRNHFDRDVAREVADSRCIRLPEDFDKVNTLATLLADMSSRSIEHDFMVHYVVRLKEKISAKAGCGCTYHAEQGEPCEHDWQIAAPTTNAPYPGLRCLTDNEMSRHVEGKMDDDELIEADAHMRICDKCFTLLENLHEQNANGNSAALAN